MRVSIFAALASLVLLGVVFELIRSRRLRERYALLWLLTATVMLGLSVWRSGLHSLSSVMGIAYPPNALFVLGSLFILVLLLHYSTVISRLSDQNTMLAQRLALLEEKVNEARQRPRLRDVSRNR